MRLLVVTACAAFLLSVVLTPLVRRAALAAGAVALPKADRWHRQRIPLLGGVAIVLATTGGVVLSAPHSPAVWALLGAGVLISLVGLVDDLRPLTPQSKFIAQILVASLVAALGLQLPVTHIAGLNVLITIVWIVGLTNAFNLLDNMDGLAAGIAVIATGFRLAFLLMDGNMDGAALAAGLVGALVGFLLFNFNPASIFMGDAGSLFIGVVVSGLSLLGGWSRPGGALSVLLFPVLLVVVPIFDTAFVTIARALAGRSIATGGSDHTSHRLVALGLSERRAVLLLYAVAVVSGSVAYLGYRNGLSQGGVLVVLFGLGVVIFGVFLGRLRVYPEDAEAAGPGARMVTLIAELPYKRQVATVLVDFVLITVAYYSAYLLRFETVVGPDKARLIESLPIVIACQLGVFASFRVYEGVWRYTAVSDLITLAKAATAGVVASVLVLLFAFRFAGYSRAVFVIDWILLVLLVAGTRLSFRALSELLHGQPADVHRVLVYGAGDGGVMVLREIRNNRALGREVVGFLDDDRSKQWTRIQGVPVLGGLDSLEEVVRAQRADEVIVSSAKVDGSRVSELAARCEPLGVAVLRSSLRLD